MCIINVLMTSNEQNSENRIYILKHNNTVLQVVRLGYRQSEYKLILKPVTWVR